VWIFESPAYLLLLSLIPPGIWAAHRWKNRGGTLPFSLSVWKGDSLEKSTFLLRTLDLISHLLFWGGFVLLVVALAGPGRVEKERIYLTRGIDIVFVLDESPSMAAQDFYPNNRFDTAREVIKTFIRSRENDPVGLVVFSDDAALKVPPTLDYSAYLRAVDDLALMSLGKGTAIGMGLAVAALHLKGSSAQEKIIILLTDGENNAGEITPESAAEIAGSLGIKIYAIGVGGEGAVPGEYRDPESGKTFRGIFSGTYDEELLQKIAEATGGRYYSASTPGALETVFRSIDSLAVTEKRIKVKIETVPAYRIFLLLGAVSILLYLVVRKALLREVL
jgi:Ca-activated chloride channel homolog